MACEKRRAEVSSRGKSLRVLKLVSIASTIESGRADSRPKTEIFCSLPSSRRWKSSFLRFAIGLPCSSVTVTNTFTSFTSTLTVLSGSWDVPESLPSIAARRNNGCSAPQPECGAGKGRGGCSRPAGFLNESDCFCNIGSRRAENTRPHSACAAMTRLSNTRRGSRRFMDAASLRCGLYRRSTFRPSDFCRKWLPVCPHRAVLKIFFLPDRYGTLERIN